MKQSKYITRHTLVGLLILASFMIIVINPTMKTQALAQSTTPTPIPTPPYDTIELEMYHLEPEGDIVSGLPLCRLGDTAYGCNATIGEDGPAYPFGEKNPVTLHLESELIEGQQQGYIHNVTAKELGPQTGSQGNKPFSAVLAQAIAVRTYAYQRHANRRPAAEGGYGPMNNSSQFQVYLPYFYEQGLSRAAQRNRVDAAVREVLYMAPINSSYAVESLFGQDNRERTTAGNRSYLASVSDPISNLYGCALAIDDEGRVTRYGSNADCGTGFGGMSSKGASRWAFGHTSSVGPVATTQPSYPGDANGLGNFWPVQYDEAYQILTHYYTGVHIRDGAGNLKTPAYRWNALDIRWSGVITPPKFTPGSTSQTKQATITLQNSDMQAV